MVVWLILANKFDNNICIELNENYVMENKDIIIIDDIIDSGKTFSQFPNHRKAAMYGKKYSPKIDYVYAKKEWRIDIPFEKEKPTEDNITRILEYIGEDPTS